MKFSGALVIFIALIRLVQAQSSCNLKIAGHVNDHSAIHKLQGVSVKIQPINLFLETDSKGNFEFKNLCQGQYTLQLTRIGFKKHEQILDLSESMHVDFILHEDTCLLETVTIQDRTGKNAVQVESGLNNEQLFALTGLSLSEALKTIPGMNSLQTGPNISKPILHGLHSNRLLIQNAGLKQEDQQWGGEHAPEIDPGLSDQIKVVKGAAGLRYGPEAMGGAVIVEPRELLKKSGLEASFMPSWGFANRQWGERAFLRAHSAKLKGLSFNADLNAKKSGNMRTPNYIIGNSGLEEWTTAYRIGLAKKWGIVDFYYSLYQANVGIPSAAHAGSQMDLIQAISNGQPKIGAPFSYQIARPYQDLLHELSRFKLGLYNKRGDLWSFNVGRQFNDRKEYDSHLPRNDSLRALNAPQLSFQLTTYQADVLYEQSEAKLWKQTIGASYQNQSNIWDGRYLIPNFISQQWSGFYIWQYEHQRHGLEIGVRYDQKNQEAFFNEKGIISSEPRVFNGWAGSVGHRYTFQEGLDWRNHIGLAWRPPTINELYSAGLHHGAASLEFGDTKLGQERGVKWITSLSWKGDIEKSDGLWLDAYLHHIDQYIYLKPTGELRQTIRGSFPVMQYTGTEVTLYGTDLSYQRGFFKNYNYSLKGSIIYGYDHSQQRDLPFLPPPQMTHTLAFQTKGKHRITLAPQVHFVAKQRWAPREADLTETPAGYVLLNFDISGQDKVKNPTWAWGIALKNIADTPYKDYMNRLRYFIQEPGFQVTARFQIFLQSKSLKSS